MLFGSSKAITMQSKRTQYKSIKLVYSISIWFVNLHFSFPPLPVDMSVYYETVFVEERFIKFE